MNKKETIDMRNLETEETLSNKCDNRFAKLEELSNHNTYQIEQMELEIKDMVDTIFQLKDECRLLRRLCLTFTLIVPLVIIIMLVQ